jgi:hypothetical protein
MKKFYEIGTIIACFTVLVLILRLTEKTTPHSNAVDLSFAPYSDKHITQAAISTDLDRRDMAFAPSDRTSLLFSNQIASAVRSVRSMAAPTKEIDASKEYGTWVWTPVLDMTPEYVDSLIEGAKTDGLNSIYVSIDSYLDIFTMPKGTEKEALKDRFSYILDSLIAQAHEQGIAVDAEAGWRNWAEEGNQYKAFAVVNFVKNFNSSHENKFRGFQYDIEPYLLDSYKESYEGKAAALKNFVRLVDETQSFLGASELRFSLVVPDFYDSKDKATPAFSYSGSRNHVFGHLLDILDRRFGSSIILMSYRNFASGQDGSIEISNNEMLTAKSGAHATKIIIAQETGEFPPPYITFHGTSRKYMEREVSKISGVFGSHPNFGGLAFHYANALIELK